MTAWLAGRRLQAADLRESGNAFTLLRWVLATSVMFSHGWDLTTGTNRLDPSVPILGLPVSGLAVFLFFTLSGFLVTGSLLKRGPAAFALARALRLVPGLWVMLILVTFGLGALFGTLPFEAYVQDPAVWRFLARNASLLTADYMLPGVFKDLPVIGVNGSLWTIPQEVRCYIVLGLLGAFGALQSRRWVLIAFGIGLAVHLALPIDIVPALERPRQLAVSFFLGVVAYQWRSELRWSWPLALAGAAVALLIVQLQVAPAVTLVVAQIAFAYLTGVAAFCAPHGIKRFSAGLPDYSYGIYIYAFPAQQSMIALGYGTTPAANILLAFIALLPFAAASWHLVEQPALRLKPRARDRDSNKVSENLTHGETTVGAPQNRTTT